MKKVLTGFKHAKEQPYIWQLSRDRSWCTEDAGADGIADDDCETKPDAKHTPQLTALRA